jgi:adenylate kinase
MIVILLGAPGVGKGTQAKKIVNHFHIPQISTGDILRKEVRENTELGRKVSKIMESGELVPDDLILEIIEKRITLPDCKDGFILDGFPRTIPQAKGLHSLLNELNLPAPIVIEIFAPDEEIIRRLTSRRVCSNCGKDYNLNLNPPPPDGKCVICGGKIVQREDDNEKTVRQRLKVYRKETQPLIDYYNNKHQFHRLDGQESIDDLFRNIKEILK